LGRIESNEHDFGGESCSAPGLTADAHHNAQPARVLKIDAIIEEGCAALEKV
jgi:hypothetical protein